MRVRLKPVIEFSRKNNAKNFIGEFGCIVWAPNGRAEYLRDCIEFFEEYGWDWTYHAFREWPGWSVEHEFHNKKFIDSPDNPAKRTMLNALKKNNAFQ